MLTEKQVLAYYTVACDLDGKAVIQQVQYRDLILRDGVPVDDGKVGPVRLLVAPQDNDVIEGVLTDALGELNAALVGQAAEAQGAKEQAQAATEDAAQLRAQLAEKDATIAGLEIDVASLRALLSQPA